MQTSILNREPRPCILVRLACTRCGMVRMAIPPQADTLTTLECPYCFAPAKATQLGTGQTLRDLPYFEAEANLDVAIRAQPHFGASPLRVAPGVLVVLCRETSVLHLAAVRDVHTSRLHLGPTGQPSISFILAANETGPVPHVSCAPDSPPWWCYPEEIKSALPGSKNKSRKN